MRKYLITSLIFFLVLLTGCFRGTPSEDTPLHLNPNMDVQQKYVPFKESDFFANGSAMRMPVDGTVARGNLREDIAYFTGKDENGSHINKIPLDLNMELLERGQERYNIYCAPCHDASGSGQGMVVKRGFLPPPSFHLDRIRKFPAGYYFDVISNGVRNMPSYKAQIPVSDRWKIVAYVRALQRSQNASLEDIPEENHKDIN